MFFLFFFKEGDIDRDISLAKNDIDRDISLAKNDIDRDISLAKNDIDRDISLVKNDIDREGIFEEAERGFVNNFFLLHYALVLLLTLSVNIIFSQRDISVNIIFTQRDISVNIIFTQRDISVNIIFSQREYICQYTLRSFIHRLNKLSA